MKRHKEAGIPDAPCLSTAMPRPVIGTQLTGFTMLDHVALSDASSTVSAMMPLPQFPCPGIESKPMPQRAHSLFN